MTPRLSPARLPDTPWLMRILARGRGVRTDRTDRHTLTRLIREGQVVCARGMLAPVGFLIRHGDTIHALYVSPRAQGRGIGRRLIEDAKQGSDRLELWCAQTNTRARAFYARHGFHETAFGTGAANDEGAPDVRMTWVRDFR